MASISNASDLYKCTKIRELIPGIVKNINAIENYHELYQMNINLKSAKREFESITPIKETMSESEVEEFRDRLYTALMALATGIRTTDISVLEPDKRAGLVSIMAEMASYQDDINRIASK